MAQIKWKNVKEDRAKEENPKRNNLFVEHVLRTTHTDRLCSNEWYINQVFANHRPPGIKVELNKQWYLHT